MRFLLLLFLCMINKEGFSYETITRAMAAENGGVAVAVGMDHICALTDDEVVCWGKNGEGQIDVPDLRNPQILSVGMDHNCALDDAGVKCWGEDSKWGGLIVDVPAMKYPHLVSAGGVHSCAVDGEKVKCWGIGSLRERDSSWDSSLDRLHAPSFSNLLQWSAGDMHTCAVADGQVLCWGDYGQAEVPQFENPQQVSAGNHHTCAIDDQGLRCWGVNKFKGLEAFVFNKPHAVSVGYDLSCIIVGTKVNCWNKKKFGVTNIPELINPRQISAGYSQACAVDDIGVNCWGREEERRLKIPDQLQEFFSFSVASRRIIFRVLQKLAANSYSYRAAYYTAFAQDLDNKSFWQNPEEGEYVDLIAPSLGLILKLISPMIYATETQKFKNKILPRFIQGEKNLAKNFGIRSLDDIPLTYDNLRLCFVAIVSSLRQSRGFLPEADERIASLLQEVGRLNAALLAQHDSYPTAAITLSTLLENHPELIAAMIEGKRTKAFGEVLTLVKGYLR